MNGTVFNIQRFSLHDGTSVRTVVFLKGCPLSCLWCHNPEGIYASPQLGYDAAKCIMCRKCWSVCKYGVHSFSDGGHTACFHKCRTCFTCADTCPSGALSRIGFMCDEEYIISEVLKDKKYYGTDGGITLSGGEPLYQPDFAVLLLKSAKAAGLDTAVETSGYAPPDVILEAAEYTDTFLYDYKLTDPDEHKKYTGVSNEMILDNLRLLNDIGAHVILRCPLIPGVNMKSDHYDGIASIAKNFACVTEVQLLPYHSLASVKAARIGMVAKCAERIPDNREIEEARAYISQMTGKKPVSIVK